MMVVAMVVMVVVLDSIHTDLRVVVAQADTQAMEELESAQEQAASVVPLPHVKVSMVLLDQVAEAVAEAPQSDAEILMEYKMLVLVVAWVSLGKAATGPQVRPVVTGLAEPGQVDPANYTEEEAA
jgi:hypothetical protein